MYFILGLRNLESTKARANKPLGEFKLAWSPHARETRLGFDWLQETRAIDDQYVMH